MGLRNFRSTRYASVAATLALLFSLAGTGTAATYTVSRLTGKDVKDGSLTLRDLSPASIKALSGGDGTGVVATSLRLAGYVHTPALRRFPDDSPSASRSSALEQAATLTKSPSAPS